MTISHIIPCYVDKMYPQVGISKVLIIEKLGHKALLGCELAANALDDYVTPEPFEARRTREKDVGDTARRELFQDLVAPELLQTITASRSTATTVSAWASGVIEPFDYAVCGHWHATQSLSINNRILWVNGSTESENTWLQEEIKAKCPPAQWMLALHPEHGVTAEHRVWL